jgi:hypothetical protein
METTMMTTTKCVSCELAALRARAKRAKRRISLLRGSRFGFGGRLVPKGMRGWDVYIHPLWIDLRDPQWTYGKRKRYWVAWFWQLDDRCTCHE